MWCTNCRPYQEPSRMQSKNPPSVVVTQPWLRQEPPECREFALRGNLRAAEKETFETPHLLVLDCLLVPPRRWGPNPSPERRLRPTRFQNCRTLLANLRSTKVVKSSQRAALRSPRSHLNQWESGYLAYPRGQFRLRSHKKSSLCLDWPRSSSLQNHY